MASMTQLTPTSPLHPIARQRVAFLLLLIVSLAAASIAMVAVQRQSVVSTVPAPPQGATVTEPERNRVIVEAYENLQLQRLAAVQALRAGNTEAYEIAMSGAEALQSRIASLQARQSEVTDRDRAIIEMHDQLQLQRLAAAQALRAGNTEAYEIAMSGAEALQSRITSLQAQR